jgi:murein DD-endopeptidase MepM/ murein hydrolase activator NlpD
MIIHPTTTSNIGIGFGATTFEFYDDKVWHGVLYSNFHGGIDYWGPLGYPIWATTNGVVLYAGYAVPYIGGAGGNGVVIQHGDSLKSIYGHMDTVEVTPGMQVIQGQRIGTMGASGIANGVNHLHFEVRTTTDAWGEDVENPYELMQGGSLSTGYIANSTEDIPWIEPLSGSYVRMALCVYEGNNTWSTPTAASAVTAVYFDRMKAATTMFTVSTSSGRTIIQPTAALDPEVEVRADYTV